MPVPYKVRSSSFQVSLAPEIGLLENVLESTARNITEVARARALADGGQSECRRFTDAEVGVYPYMRRHQATVHAAIERKRSSAAPSELQRARWLEVAVERRLVELRNAIREMCPGSLAGLGEGGGGDLMTNLVYGALGAATGALLGWGVTRLMKR